MKNTPGMCGTLNKEIFRGTSFPRNNIHLEELNRMGQHTVTNTSLCKLECTAGIWAVAVNLQRGINLKE